MAYKFTFISRGGIIDTKIEEYKKIWGDIPGLGPDYPQASMEEWGELPGDFDFESVESQQHEHDYESYSDSVVEYRAAHTVEVSNCTHRSRLKTPSRQCLVK